jgi:methylmalonyl-CoA mutase N-terminal domain/subunit
MAEGSSNPFQHDPDKPWIFRTYAGHSTAEESNKLYRKNLSKGQTGLSIAFDLPTQTAYDSDHILSRGRSRQGRRARRPLWATCARCSTRSRSRT